MEALPKLTSNELPGIIVPTISAFYGLLEKNAQEIGAIQKKSFRYGTEERQELDIYYPPSPPADGKKAPILIWVYGGGFTTGNRNYPPPFDLGYANLGSYFAKKSFITVIPDYRLVPSVAFPQPADDIRDATLWITNNPENLSNPTAGVYPDLDNVYLMGHSAGGAHVTTALLLDTPESAELRSKVAGWIGCAGMYTAGSLKGDMVHTIGVQYYGTEEKLKENNPLGLLNKASDEIIQTLPRSVLYHGENEPDWALDMHRDFEKGLRSRLDSTKFGGVIVGKGHNHLSYNWALGSGEGEQWADDILKWIESNRS